MTARGLPGSPDTYLRWRVRGPRRPRPGSCSVSGLPARSPRELGVGSAVDGVLPAWKDVRSEPSAGVSWLRVGWGRPRASAAAWADRAALRVSLALAADSPGPGVPVPVSHLGRSHPALHRISCVSVTGGVPPPGPVHHHQRQTETAAFPLESTAPCLSDPTWSATAPQSPMKSAGAAHAAGWTRLDRAVRGQINPVCPRDWPCWAPGRPGFKDIFFL